MDPKIYDPARGWYPDVKRVTTAPCYGRIDQHDMRKLHRIIDGFENVMVITRCRVCKSHDVNPSRDRFGRPLFWNWRTEKIESRK